MILILIKHTAANSAHGGQQENLITTDRLLCAMVLVTNYLSRISISIDLCIYSFRSLLSNAKTDATVPISVFVFEVYLF